MNSSVRAGLSWSIEKFPGIRYRELMRLAKITNGVMSYHINFLEKTGVIKIERQGGVTRFYPTNMREHDRVMLGKLRQKTTRQIVLFILSNKSISFNDIVEHVECAPSTVSWHLKKLREVDLVQTKQVNGHLFYTINQKDEVVSLLNTYRASFLDEMVDSFVDTWHEL
jgi:predicted transcriptional regulator